MAASQILTVLLFGIIIACGLQAFAVPVDDQADNEFLIVDLDAPIQDPDSSAESSQVENDRESKGLQEAEVAGTRFWCDFCGGYSKEGCRIRCKNASFLYYRCTLCSCQCK